MSITTEEAYTIKDNVEQSQKQKQRKRQKPSVEPENSVHYDA